jgi:hypothetical protein
VLRQTYELFNDWGRRPSARGQNPSFRHSPLRVATRHRGYSHTLFTFFAGAVLIRPFIAELAHAETVPL